MIVYIEGLTINMDHVQYVSRQGAVLQFNFHNDKWARQSFSSGSREAESNLRAAWMANEPYCDLRGYQEVVEISEQGVS